MEDRATCRRKQSWGDQIFQWKNPKLFLYCALETTLHGTGLAWALMGHLSSSTAETQTSCCDRRMTRDFDGVIRDSKLPTTLRQEDMKSKHLTAHQNDNENCLLTEVQQLKVNAVAEFQPWLHIKVAMNTFSSTDYLRPGVARCQAAARCGWSTEYLSDWPSHFHCRHVSGAPWDSYQAYRINLFCTEYGYNEHPVFRTLSMTEQQQPYHLQKNRETRTPGSIKHVLN